MLTTPKTPKRTGRMQRHDVYEPSKLRMIQQGTPMHISPLQQPVFSHGQDITIGNKLSSYPPMFALFKSPPGAKCSFVPNHTSTPAPIPPVEGFRLSELSTEIPSMIAHSKSIKSSDTIELDSEDELTLPPVPAGTTSPVPRPASEPLFNRYQSYPRAPPRPATAEPIDARKPRISARSPVRKRAVAKCTLAKTPFCARPTKSWLNRIACFHRDD